MAIGSEVSGFRVGQRVLGQVIADWLDGDAPAVLHQHTLGSSLPGTLSDYVLFPRRCRRGGAVFSQRCRGLDAADRSADGVVRSG
ncbi:hypothetical protein [Mesorhizobium sp.]|uniref:hypothetical protein n=1 Tax=Mesorhizobium sp. TaxID=1871066 RepID=UPI0025DD1761|nr:hypothetical protein [Mesorhizobium sp.]